MVCEGWSVSDATAGSHDSGSGLKLSLCGLIEGAVDAMEPLRDLSPSVGTTRNVSRELTRGRDMW